VLLAVVRGSGAAASGKYSLAVVNTGEGLQYHPVAANAEPPSPSLPLRQTALVVSAIPVERLQSSGFWYLVYRQLLCPAEANGPGVLYGKLLPFTNQKPLSSNFGTEPAGWISRLPVPAAGDQNFACCVERALALCLVAAGLSAEEASWWSGVRLRQALLATINDALPAASTSPISAGDIAVVRVAASSLARAAAEHAGRFHKAEGAAEGRDQPFLLVKQLIEQTHSKLDAIAAGSEGGLLSVQPPCAPPLDAEFSKGVETDFDNFERLLREDVEKLKGEVDPPRILIPALTSKLPLSVKNPFEAAACCRLTAHLLTLLINQQDQISHAAASCFALVAHLMTRLLPLPLPLDHPERAERCFWAQEMQYETKADLMRHLYLVARHFAASSFTLRANRETDGARVVVAGALAAIMDALMRRPVNFLGSGKFDGSQATLHYSGLAEGPGTAYGLDPGIFAMASESLLLVAPEYASLRALVLDYFTSIRQQLDERHVIFSFDQSMQCGEGDREFISQVGLCLGVPAARREAHLLITGQRPELLELFLELMWFRDVVFLWKMLMLPSDSGPSGGNWRATDSILQWSWQKEHFVVRGFDSELSPAARPEGFTDLVKKPFDWLFGKYQSKSKAVSAASASVLAGAKVDTEDDVLFLEHVPSFNDTLKPSDSELLLTYLTAPYIRVPLLLGFFADRERVSLLREPLLQSVLDAALFEPGPWQSKKAAAAGPPDTVPAAFDSEGGNRTHLATPAGLLFNELLCSPKVVLDTVLVLLKVAVEKDPGRPGSANEGLILYLVRLAVRVESYLLFVVRHARRGGYLERSGAHWEAKVRGLPTAGAGDDALVSHLELLHRQLREALEGKVSAMLLYWTKAAAKRRDTLLASGCRAHAHLALICKNVPAESFGARDAAIFLSAQVFLNMNHRWFKHSATEAAEGTGDGWLGVCEFELFDMFEGRRSLLAGWLKANKEEAQSVLQRVEWVATFRGSVDGLNQGEDDQSVEWIEVLGEPGNFVPKAGAPTKEWRAAQGSEKFQPWLLRVTHGPAESGGQISVNLGRYNVKGDGLSLVPDWAVESQDFCAAFGHSDVHCSDKEVSANRVWKQIVGHHHDLQRWVADDRGLDADPYTSVGNPLHLYSAGSLASEKKWLAEVLEPVRSKVAILGELALFFQESSGLLSQGAGGVARLAGLLERDGEGKQPKLRQLKEVMVYRNPPVVEVYDVIESGRQFYRSLAFCSDSKWCFHAPKAGELALQNQQTSSWSLAGGSTESIFKPSSSVLVFRQVVDQAGRQLYVPPSFLRGLLPDALIERYSFWRSEGAVGWSSGDGLIIGDEIKQCDMPTRLHVSIRKDPASPGLASAFIQRLALKEPAGATRSRYCLW
ncbi:unnamed protein product, partial [Polarella glacialis]